MFSHRSLVIAAALLLAAPVICESQQARELGVRTPTTRDSTVATPPDSFAGPDKVKHFFMSGFIEAVGFSSLQAAGADRSAALGAATAMTMSIGVGREVHDRRTKGLFSLGDLMWDALGTAASLLLISQTQR